jgi:hypothetical protein
MDGEWMDRKDAGSSIQRSRKTGWIPAFAGMTMRFCEPGKQKPRTGGACTAAL